MAILPTTFGLLFILALLAIYEFADLKRAECVRKIYQARFYEEEMENCIQLHKRADTEYTNLTRNVRADQQDYDPIDQDEATIPSDKGSTMMVTLSGGPIRNTRFLHIGSLFTTNTNTNTNRNTNTNTNTNTIEEAKKKTAWILLASLIRVLYEEEEFFKEAEKEYPELERVLIKRVIEKAGEANDKKIPIKSAKDLARLDLGDRVLKKALYHMLKGTKSRRKGSDKQAGYFSLIDFVTFRNQGAVASVWLAPKPILMAIFGDEGVVEEVCRKRKGMKGRARKASQADRNSYEGELKQDFISLLPLEIDQSMVSFRVTATEPKD